MVFLDKNRGIFFKANDIRNAMEQEKTEVPTLRNIYRSLNGIIKRNEYELFVVRNQTGHKVKLYRRK